MKKIKVKKVYIVRKYVVADSVQQALKIQHKFPIDDCYIEEKSINNYIEKIIKPEDIKIGFKK